MATSAASPLAPSSEDKVILREFVDELARKPDGRGLNEVMDALHKHGLEKQADSWIQSSPNMDVSGTQLQAALTDTNGPLSPDWANQVGAACGLQAAQVFEHLAQILPALIERLTPRGELPSQDIVGQTLLNIRKQLVSVR
jgi:uncharacterized protein YidB (DUF937 family)